ncbi:MAG: DUF2752 domain-containing protein [Lachnospiraceae bacterium]|nr:DUF2752 domain-containing protein [Lachnospiraceae bacterium]
MRDIVKRIKKDFQNFWMAAVAIGIYMILVNVIFRAFCPMVIVTGLPCPGCGMTRSVIYLLTGHVSESIHIHPMGIVVVCLFLYFAWNRYIIGRNPKGMMVIIAIALVALIAFYIWRMYLYFPDRVPYVYKEGNLLERTFPYYKEILHELRIL